MYKLPYGNDFGRAKLLNVLNDHKFNKIYPTKLSHQKCNYYSGGGHNFPLSQYCYCSS